jgi:hypothetical protein
MPSSTRASRYAQCYWFRVGRERSRSPCRRRSPTVRGRRSGRVSGRAWSKSNSSRLLRGRDRAVPIQSSPPCPYRAATSRCRQAARYSSCVQASLRVRSASRGADSRRLGGFQRPSQIGDVGGHVPGGGFRGHNCHPFVESGRTQRGVMVDELALFHLVSAAGCTRANCCCRSASEALTWTGSVIVWCRAQAVDGRRPGRPHTRPGPGPGRRGPSAQRPTTLGCTE